MNGIQRRLASAFSNKNKNADLTWFKEKYLKHATPGTTRTYMLDGKKIYYTRPSEFLYALKEIFVEEIYKIDLPSNANILDCGANIGLSVIYLKRQFPKSRVIAFEPDNSNFDLLKKNVHSFELENVELIKKAVWIEDTTLSFSNEGTMGSKIDSNAVNATKVEATRIKNYLNQRIHFLKIDIEGAEYSVLKDISEQLNNVENLFLEYHGTFNQINELTEILNILHKAGFAYYIKEAAEIYKTPFLASTSSNNWEYDIQLNIFCFRRDSSS